MFVIFSTMHRHPERFSSTYNNIFSLFQRFCRRPRVQLVVYTRGSCSSSHDDVCSVKRA